MTASPEQTQKETRPTKKLVAYAFLFFLVVALVSFLQFRRFAADPGANFLNQGLHYDLGEGVSQDYVKAREFYQKGADAGNAQAMNNLGALYEEGQGVSQDYAMAREWYEKAANAGFPHAMGNLGLLYYKGEGVSQDL